MSIADRKRRAFLARETLVIEEADGLLAERGYLGLNLDELAERVEYSKATLYHHFQSKEDLMLAVVTSHVRRRVDYFSRAALFRGESRERMFGIGIADLLLSRESPHSFPLAQLVGTESIWGKCSSTRQEESERLSRKCYELGFTVAEDAKAKGDFSEWSPEPLTIVSGLISLSKGAHLLSHQLADTPMNPIESLFKNYHFYLDGVGWRPFLKEFDYEDSERRIKAELFAEEFATLD